MGFKPPRRSALWVAAGGWALPIVLRRIYGIGAVHFRDVDLELLQGLAGERVLVTPNHPTNAEPAILFGLGRRARLNFTFVSNREAFDKAWGLFGLLLQKCGAYSIVRGAPDRESFKFTRNLLSQPNHLVIFPEGEVYSQNDSLLPFQAGVFQLAMMAQLDTLQSGSGPPVYVVPVAIRYRFIGDIGREIVAAMGRLEQALALDVPPPGGTYARLRRIGDAVLTATEAAYKIPQGSPDDLNPRMDAVRHKIIERVADAMHLPLESLGKTLPDQMRTLMNRLNGVSLEDTRLESDYEYRLFREEHNRVRPLLNDLRRLANWLAVRDGYVAENPTQERVVDTIWRLESEVLGHRELRGLRECHVRLGGPIDLRLYAEGYASDRKGTLAAITDRVEDAVAVMLEEMAEVTAPS